jgi:hypothetical protein
LLAGNGRRNGTTRWAGLAPASGQRVQAAGRPPGLKEVLVKRLRNLDLGGVLFGLIVLGVGVYYLLDRTFGISMPNLNWDKVWPLFVVALGAAIVFSSWAKGRGEGPGA